jgi:hypothetical protein
MKRKLCLAPLVAAAMLSTRRRQWRSMTIISSSRGLREAPRRAPCETHLVEPDVSVRCPFPLPVEPFQLLLGEALCLALFVQPHLIASVISLTLDVVIFVSCRRYIPRKIPQRPSSARVLRFSS